MKDLNMLKRPSNISAELAIKACRLFTPEGAPLDIVNTGVDSFKAYCTLLDKEELQFTLDFCTSKALKEGACIMKLVLTFHPMAKVYEEYKVVGIINKFLLEEEERRGIKIFGGAQVRNFPRIIDGVGRYTTVSLSFIVEVPRD